MQEWTTRGHAISRLQVQGLLPSGQQGRSIAIIIAKGPYNSQDKHPTSPLLLPLHQRGRRNNSYPHQIHSLRVSTSLREALLLLGRLLADRIGCEVDPIGNECICRLDLQQTADSFLRRCVSDNCGSHAFDVSSAVSIYAEYCTSNGYTRGDVHHADDRDDFIRYADRLCGRNGECHARCWRLGDDVCGRRSLD
ncbi:hypothetical protein KXV92_007693 [Aspergillus fumigatus]|nr:hypothetical protein KXX42_005377 [Aspergillus fumigatus]KAH3207612.1 hypothetical protein KXV92_007693 [Aspergillus fumigatus]